ncbi:MAG TPA: hypothetical protein VLX92_23105 [Kofleriaceae bacterium]|nr:hypothetical protein [Kofleriaceae bacterium]
MARRLRVPIDVVALAAIAVVVMATHRHALRVGLDFGEPSWLFELGRRARTGALPASPYGPLPIYIEAAIQSVRSSYMATVYAALLVQIARVQIAWMLVRRIAGLRAAAAIAAFCAIDPIASATHHAAGTYLQLAVGLVALGFVIGSRAGERIAGVSAALIGAVLPVAGIVFALAVAATRSRRAILGCAITQVAIVAALAATGTLALPAVAPHDLLRAVSGGAIDAHHGWMPAPLPWDGLVFFLALPIAIVAVLAWLARRDVEVDAPELAIAALPLGLLVTLVAEHAALGTLDALPRMLLAAVAIAAACSPARARSWLGIEPRLAVVLAAMPLASDWSLALGVRGHDAGSLIVGAVLLALASAHVPGRIKLALSCTLALTAAIHLAVAAFTGVNLYGAGSPDDARVHDPRAVLRGVRLDPAHEAVLAWLATTVRPGSTCFVAGDLPLLYALLDCENPTRLDSTAAGFAHRDELAHAIEVLEAHPPEVIIVAEPIDDALRPLLDRYHPIGASRDILDKPLLQQAAGRRTGSTRCRCIDTSAEASALSASQLAEPDAADLVRIADRIRRAGTSAVDIRPVESDIQPIALMLGLRFPTNAAQYSASPWTNIFEIAMSLWNGSSGMVVAEPASKDSSGPPSVTAATTSGEVAEHPGGALHRNRCSAVQRDTRDEDIGVARLARRGRTSRAAARDTGLEIRVARVDREIPDERAVLSGRSGEQLVGVTVAGDRKHLPPIGDDHVVLGHREREVVEVASDSERYRSRRGCSATRSIRPTRRAARPA